MTGNRSRLFRVLNVVFMDPAQKLGSMEEQMVLLAHAFRSEEGLFLPLFSCATLPSKPTPIETSGVPIASLDLGQFRWKTLVQLMTIVREHQIDIVNWNFSPPLLNSYLWCLSALQPQLSHFYTDHISRTEDPKAAGSFLKRNAKQLLLRRYSKVLCVSTYVLKCLAVEQTWSNACCCLHFINVERFQPDSQTRSRFRAEQRVADRFVLLSVAHLIKAKGIDVALRAMTKLPDNVVLWVVGTGQEEPALRSLSQELGIDHRVVFHGPQQHVEPYMQAADCFICPSRWAEAAGLVNIEAQACGLPVIASNLGGIPEHVIDGETGFLVTPNDPIELADRVTQLMADRELWRRFSQAARVFVEETFSPAVRLPDLLSHYRSSSK